MLGASGRGAEAHSSGSICSGGPSAPDFLELIQGQNPGLFTDQWVLRHRQAIGNGTLLVFGIDGDSAGILAD